MFYIFLPSFVSVFTLFIDTQTPNHYHKCTTLCNPMDCSPPRLRSLSMGFPWQEYRSRLLFPPPGDLPNPEIKPKSPALAGRFFTKSEQPGKPIHKG